MNKEINIDLKRCFKAVLKKWWLIIIIGAAFFAMAYMVSVNNPREDGYTAEATVLSVSEYSSLTVYSDIITSSRVCERAANLLGITDLNADLIKKMISVKTYSLVLGIHATSTDKILAMKVANVVAAVFVEEVNYITSNNLARLLDEATTVDLTYNKQLEQWKIRIVVTFAGVFLICGWIIAREIFTHKIHTLSDISLDGELQVIGTIPLFKNR